MNDAKPTDMSIKTTLHQPIKQIDSVDTSGNTSVEGNHVVELNDTIKACEMDENIAIIRGQTNYDDATIRDKLATHNNDIMAVIREYMKPASQTKLPEVQVSTNQKIYNEIRNYMDDINEGYTRRQSDIAANQ